MYWKMEPKNITTQNKLDKFTSKEKETWKLHMKLWNNKSEKVMDDLGQA